MRHTVTRSVLLVDHSEYQIAVVVSGDVDCRYTAEWYREGESKLVQLGINVDNAYDAEELAQKAIRKQHK
jgi:hypothetical protein